jgi:LysR family transcriptional regulator, carnitine catabolism transcriptional activator
MVIRPDKNTSFKRVSTRWTTLTGQTLISLTSNYPHQQLIDQQLDKSGVVCNRDQTVNLLDTQIGLVEAHEALRLSLRLAYRRAATAK